MSWLKVGDFSVLRVPNGIACLTEWANPSYCHGVIMYSDGRVEAVPTTDHHANQSHMKGLAGPFTSSRDAAMAFVESKLIKPEDTRRTFWERVAK